MKIEAVVDAALEQTGGSQIELGRRVGRSGAAVNRWQHGKAMPDFESCVMLAAITGYPVDDVLRSAGYDPEPLRAVKLRDQDDPATWRLSPVAQEVDAALEQIGAHDRPHAERAVRGVLGAFVTGGLDNTPPHGAGNRTNRLVTGNPRRGRSGEEGRQNRALRALSGGVMATAKRTVTAQQALAA